MAVDVFMKIDGISGESVDLQYKDWIEVLSLNWEVDISGTAMAKHGVLGALHLASPKSWIKRHLKLLKLRFK